MFTRFLIFFLLLGPATRVLATSAKNCGGTCCKPKEACCPQPAECPRPVESTAAEPAKSHPLRGVVVSVQAERSELTVKHEAIPGVMRAMTMVFKVDAATVKSVRPGQAVTARMTRINDEWWLQDVKNAPSSLPRP